MSFDVLKNPMTFIRCFNAASEVDDEFHSFVFKFTSQCIPIIHDFLFGSIVGMRTIETLMKTKSSSTSNKIQRSWEDLFCNESCKARCFLFRRDLPQILRLRFLSRKNMFFITNLFDKDIWIIKCRCELQIFYRDYKLKSVPSHHMKKKIFFPRLTRFVIFLHLE